MDLVAEPPTSDELSPYDLEVLSVLEQRNAPLDQVTIAAFTRLSAPIVREALARLQSVELVALTEAGEFTIDRSALLGFAEKMRYDF